MPDPADAAAGVSATFVEVWWLARFHAAAGTDVPAWIMTIADRRAGERLGVMPGTGSRDHSSARARPPLSEVQVLQDEHHALALSGLLDHRVPRIDAQGHRRRMLTRGV
jgi:hypothetical protein